MQGDCINMHPDKRIALVSVVTQPPVVIMGFAQTIMKTVHCPGNICNRMRPLLGFFVWRAHTRTLKIACVACNVHPKTVVSYLYGKNNFTYSFALSLQGLGGFGHNVNLIRHTIQCIAGWGFHVKASCQIPIIQPSQGFYPLGTRLVYFELVRQKVLLFLSLPIWGSYSSKEKEKHQMLYCY